jgi:hypothetical protein
MMNFISNERLGHSHILQSLREEIEDYASFDINDERITDLVDCYFQGLLMMGKGPRSEIINRNFIQIILADEGMILEFASNELKNDFEVVQQAVEQNGMALQFASDSLRDDLSIVVLATFQNRNAQQFASERLRTGHRFYPESL